MRIFANKKAHLVKSKLKNTKNNKLIIYDPATKI